MKVPLGELIFKIVLEWSQNFLKENAGNEDLEYKICETKLKACFERYLAEVKARLKIQIQGV